MAEKPLDGKRTLVLGAETPVGGAIAAALAAAGARFALVAASSDADTAFAVQRLARRSGAALAQAIDATSEMAVRVMVRQVSKALGGLDVLLFCADLGERTAEALALACRFAAREMARAGGGAIAVALPPGATAAAAGLSAQYEPKGIRILTLDVPAEPDEYWSREALGQLFPTHRSIE